LNDGQIAEITSVVNSAEISLGTLALNRAQLPATQDYARSMITMHTAAQERQTALVGASGLTPSPSAISAQLTDDVVLVRDQLESATVAELDVLYLRSQVALHSTVLETYDEQLLPNVTSDQLRAELVVARVEVAAHLEEALALLTTLEAVDGADAGVP
jgi:predicted outer membrane protein